MADRRRRVIWIIAAVLFGVPLMLALIGSMLPRDHVAQMAIELRAPREEVWSFVSDVTGARCWRDGVEIEVQPSVDGRARWIEKSRQGSTPFELISQEAPAKQVVRVVDDGLPFGGTWTWELDSASSGTRLVITEAGFVRNPIFRVMGRLFFKPTATMDGYLRALAKTLGESAEPTVLRER